MSTRFQLSYFKYAPYCVFQVNNAKDGSGTFQYFPFLSYSPSGKAEGELVYCNQGKESDFQVLDSKGISVKDRIVLMSGYGANVSKYCTQLFLPESNQFKFTLQPVRNHTNSAFALFSALLVRSQSDNSAELI